MKKLSEFINKEDTLSVGDIGKEQRITSFLGSDTNGDFVEMGNPKLFKKSTVMVRVILRRNIFLDERGKQHTKMYILNSSGDSWHYIDLDGVDEYLKSIGGNL